MELIGQKPQKHSGSTKDFKATTVLYGVKILYSNQSAIKNDTKKPETSSTSYRWSLLVCVTKKRLKMLFSQFGSSTFYYDQFAVLLRCRKMSATRYIPW